MEQLRCKALSSTLNTARKRRRKKRSRKRKAS
jgi:hypothetical protein